MCSELQLAGYYLAACGRACKVAQSAVETFRWIFSTQITGIFGNAGNVFGGFQLEIFSISQVVNHITCYKSSAHIGGKSILKKNALQDLLSSLIVVSSTNESTRVICEVICNPAYTYKFQLKTTFV